MFTFNSADFFTFLEKKALTAKENAGFNGEHHDGGYSGTMQSIEIYKAGVSGILPEMWEDSYAEYQQQADPEYAEYIRLQKKFKT